MRVMDIKKMIESIIDDLANDAPISKIMLKAQTVAHFMDNEELKIWIYHEQNGYDNMSQVPNYRRIHCAVKLNISLPNGGIMENCYFPYGLISDKKTHDFIYTLPCTDAITEIEKIAQGDNQRSIHFSLPAIVWPEIEKCIEGNIISAFQETTVASFSSIIDKMKSQLLQFFLELEQVNIDFDVLTHKETITQIMNKTINAGFINYGSGSIVSRENNIVIGNNNTISPQLKNDIERLVQQIEQIKSDIAADEEDIAEIILDIRNELEKSSPAKRLLKHSLQALKGIGNAVTEKVVELGIDQIIAQLS